jgi:hypothetical protein
MALQMEDTQLIPKTLSSGVVRFSVPNDYTWMKERTNRHVTSERLKCSNEIS